MVGTDPSRDIAVLAAQVNLPAITWGDASATLAGATVGAVGYPVLATNVASVARGVLSRTLDWDGVDLVQTDAALNPGNSGGPLFDECGLVLGVVSFKIRQTEGFSFAIAEHEVLAGLVAARANPQSPTVSTVATLEDWDALILAYDDRIFDIWDAFFASPGNDEDWNTAIAGYQQLWDDVAALRADIADHNFTADGPSCESARVLLSQAAQRLSLAVTNLRDVFISGVFEPDVTFQTVGRQLAESRDFGDQAWVEKDNC